MNRETPIMNAIHDAMSLDGRVHMWRNNVGMATYEKSPKAKPYSVRYGIVGGADLIGILRSNGRWFCLEVKTPEGELSNEQKAWHRVIKSARGFVFCVRSVEEALQALEEATR